MFVRDQSWSSNPAVSNNLDQTDKLSETFVPNDWELLVNNQAELRRQQYRLESETLVIPIKDGQVDWTVDDLIKAGGLLNVPPADVQFDNEQEMRRVFSLVYDVLRYKNILNQALKDVTFFTFHPQLIKLTPLVWLLLYDLYHRKFLKREYEKKFNNLKLLNIDDALWNYRTKLAASVSRLRIKNSALKLSQLLPPHLQDERVAKAAGVIPVSCWINSYLVRNFIEIDNKLKLNGFMEFNEATNVLGVNDYRLDPICPLFISFHPSQRTHITQCQMTHDYEIIIQDRAFCIGPAVFQKILIDYELNGSIVQTHINSPRATAYLGSLLALNDNITGLIAFSAGSRKEEFEAYMNNLGATNIKIFAERLIDMPKDSPLLENVTAIFATPPNSYSGVTDPIDLVCSRGGDLSMLQVLTETDINEDGRKRVAAILEEQRLTLKYAMSRPQIQLVLYETHSVVEAENNHMVKRVIFEMNRFAKERHAELIGRLILPPYKVINTDSTITTMADLNNNRDDTAVNNIDQNSTENEQLDTVDDDKFDSSCAYKRFSLLSQSSEYEIDPYDDITVPNCDLFEQAELPSVYQITNTNSLFDEDGCYLALIKRKEMTFLNDKYMINVAESRGLFGNNSDTKKPSSKQSVVKKKDENTPITVQKNKRRLNKNQQMEIIKRISAPTQASLSQNSKNNACMRFNRSHASAKECRRARRWWTETTQHLIQLHNPINSKSIVDEQLKTVSGVSSATSNSIQQKRIHRHCSAQYNLNRSSLWNEKCDNHAPLHLTRTYQQQTNKILFPVHISTVVMPKIAKII